MLIKWFAKDGGHLFDTNGELPKPGELVYVRGHPRSDKLGSERWRVAKSCHQVSISSVGFDVARNNLMKTREQLGLSSFTGEEVLDEVFRMIREGHGGCPNGFTEDNTGMQFTRQTGEVILEPAD